MFSRFKHVRSSAKYPILFLLGAVLTVLAILQLSNHFRNFYHRPYTIGVILNSVELEPEDYEVVKRIIQEKLKSLNSQGGIDGHSLNVIYLDDKGDPDLLQKLVEESIKDKDLIAYIGCKSSSRALAIAPILVRENVALIGGYSLTPLFQKYPNMFSGEIGKYDLQVILQSLLERKATKAAFIGRKGDLYSRILLNIMESLAARNANFQVVSRNWYAINHAFNDKEAKELADSLKQNADFLLVSMEQGPTNDLLEGLWKNGVKMPVFCGLADIAQINKNSKYYQAAELYDINPVGIPGVLNMRLQQQVPLFKQAIRPGMRQEFQLGFGGRHADEIGLLQEAATQHTLPGNASIRNKIINGLQQYIEGNRIYRGWFADWFFTSDKGFGGEPLLAWKAPGFNSPMLAPEQFLRTDSGYRPSPVLYTNHDLLNISQINDEEGSFYATFYLEISSTNSLTIKDIDFANAVRNKINQEPLIEAKLVRSKTEKNGNLFHHHLYKISGKFSFDPDLKKYPFDEQRFPVNIQTSNALKTFLVQPPYFDFRDTVFESAGWNYKNNYVGYEQDIISTENSFGSIQKNIPYYKFSFVYEMQRARIDFSLKTLVPLLAILIITYFSAFIPPREFESLCAIQVTALLSSIALYFATYKPELQYATTSDKIFIFTYIMITTIIGTSVLKYVMYRKSYALKRLALIYQRFIFPVIVVGYTIFIRWF